MNIYKYFVEIGIALTDGTWQKFCCVIEVSDYTYAQFLCGDDTKISEYLAQQATEKYIKETKADGDVVHTWSMFWRDADA